MVRLRDILAIVGAAILCAAVSNAIARPTRRLPWIGNYPDALKVPRAAAGLATTPSATPAASAPIAASPPAEGAIAEFPAHPDRPWADITGEQAVALHGRGVPFLDARRTSVYQEGHVAGARSLPIWESSVDDGIKKLFEEGYDVNAPLVVYCSGGDCEDSHMLAQRLHGYGFNNALVYTGGFPDWQKRGMPVEKGEAP